MKSQNVDCIIFDWDGTLVDSEPLNNRAVSDVLIELGFTHYTPAYCTKHLAGLSQTDVLGRIQKESAEQIDVKAIDEKIRKRIIDLYSSGVPVTTGALSFLKSIGHRYCIASNAERTLLLKALYSSDLKPFFEEPRIFTYEQVKSPKPAPDIFMYAAKVMNVQPQNCVVIEDSPTGVLGAKAAGMHVIGLTKNYPNSTASTQALLDAGADTVVQEFSEIQEMLT